MGWQKWKHLLSAPWTPTPALLSSCSPVQLVLPLRYSFSFCQYSVDRTRRRGKELNYGIASDSMLIRYPSKSLDLTALRRSIECAASTMWQGRQRSCSCSNLWLCHRIWHLCKMLAPPTAGLLLSLNWLLFPLVGRTKMRSPGNTSELAVAMWPLLTLCLHAPTIRYWIERLRGTNARVEEHIAEWSNVRERERERERRERVREW